MIRPPLKPVIGQFNAAPPISSCPPNCSLTPPDSRWGARTPHQMDVSWSESMGAHSNGPFKNSDRCTLVLAWS